MSVALIARFKNERHILYEWIHHHIAEGVDKFILIDDHSDDHYLPENPWIKDYISQGYIEIFPAQKRQQEDYDRFLPLLKKFTWMGQIDLDEFFYGARPNTSLKKMLDRQFDEVDHIVVFWKLFIHQCIEQPKSVIESNTMTHPTQKDPTSSMARKCLARTRFLEKIRVHSCEFNKDVRKIALDAHNGDIELNHYRTQSDEYLYGVKELRGGAMTPDSYRGNNRNAIDHKAFAHCDRRLKEKRFSLIQACNRQQQVKPQAYPNSSWANQSNSS